jgi:hypothetical protein
MFVVYVAVGEHQDEQLMHPFDLNMDGFKELEDINTSNCIEMHCCSLSIKQACVDNIY